MSLTKKVRQHRNIFYAAKTKHNENKMPIPINPSRYRKRIKPHL